MNTIWKFPFNIGDTVEIRVPKGATPIHVGLDPTNTPCLWCEVDDDTPNRQYLMLSIVGTGHPLPQKKKHLGSFNQGPFVWHIYL